jgi:peptidoglycan/LPS O-acetylase OafA/YrhL
MQSTIIETIAVLIACLFITAIIAGFVILKPGKRRRRRRRRHSSRPRIDLLKPAAVEAAVEPDA